MEKRTSPVGNNNSNISKNYYLIREPQYFFIFFVAAVIVIAIVMMNRSNTSFQNNHISIIKAQENAIIQRNQLLDSITTILKDSAYTKPAKETIEHISAIAVSLNDMEKEKTTRSLLELEFNKLQNEYVTLNLWCALLTVVFLIFSFYSFIKTNEMTEKGEHSYKEIHKIEMSLTRKPEEIDVKVNEAKTRLDKHVEKIEKESSKKLSDLEENISTNRTSLTEMESKLNGLQERLNNLCQEISTKKEELNRFVERKQNELNDNIENISVSVRSEVEISLRQEISTLRDSLNILTNKVKEIEVSLIFHDADSKAPNTMESREAEEEAELYAENDFEPEKR